MAHSQSSRKQGHGGWDRRKKKKSTQAKEEAFPLPAVPGPCCMRTHTAHTTIHTPHAAFITMLSR